MKAKLDNPKAAGRKATPKQERRTLARIKPQGRGIDLHLPELWAYKELLYFFAWKEVKVKYKQTLIGAGWAVLQPFVAMVVFSLVFNQVAGLPTGGLPGPVFYYSGLVIWLYFANSLSTATNSLVMNQNLITKVYFPRIYLPIAAVLANILDFVIAFVILIGIMLAYGVTPKASIWIAFPLLLLTTLAALGSGLFLSALNALYRDVRYVIPFLIQVWFFASFVVLDLDAVSEKWRWVATLNPMAVFVDAFRWCVTGQGELLMGNAAASAGIVLVISLIGTYLFSRVENVVADLV